VPALSLERVELGAGLNYVWHVQGGIEPVPAFAHEWEAGLYGAYVLVPRASLVGHIAYGFDNKLTRVEPGIRVRLTQPNDPVAFSFGANYAIWSAQGGAVPPKFLKEFEVGAYMGKALAPWALVTASSAYGLDNKRVRVEAGIRLAHSFAKGGF
jgi:hypothetical protein